MPLTKEEQDLVYNIEVLGMKPARAADIAGVPDVHHVLNRPEVRAARHTLRDSIRSYSNVTREDIIVGLRDAIDQAKIIADPTAQIRGWVEIAAITGLDRPKRVEFAIAGKAEEQKRLIAQMPDHELMQLTGGEVIDADFYDVSPAEPSE